MKSRRVVPFSPELGRILDEWRAICGGGPMLGSCSSTASDRCARDSTTWRGRPAPRAGLTEMTFHALRATWATLLADQRLPVSKLSVLLGHGDVKTTEIYIRGDAAHAAIDRAPCSVARPWHGLGIHRTECRISQRAGQLAAQAGITN